MAKSLEGLGVLLQYAALAGTSQKQYLKAWQQWCQWCVVMRMPHVLSKKNERTQRRWGPTQYTCGGSG